MNKTIDYVNTDYTEIRLASLGGFPMLRTGIKRLNNGTFKVTAEYYDKDGYLISHKTTERIVHTVDELIN